MSASVDTRLYTEYLLGISYHMEEQVINLLDYARKCGPASFASTGTNITLGSGSWIRVPYGGYQAGPHFLTLCN